MCYYVCGNNISTGKEHTMAKAKMSYLTMADRLKLTIARKTSDITNVALEVIERIPPFLLVVGPVTSRKRPGEDLPRLRSAILLCKGRGIPTFNHLPFLERVTTIVRRKLGRGELSEKENAFLQTQLWRSVYRPVLKTVKVRKLLVMTDSMGSSNVRRIKKFAAEHGIIVRVVMPKPKKH